MPVYPQPSVAENLRGVSGIPEGQDVIAQLAAPLAPPGNHIVVMRVRAFYEGWGYI